MAIGLGGGRDTRLKNGTANPEGNVTALSDTLYLQTGDYGGLFSKWNGTGPYGWVPLAQSSRGGALGYFRRIYVDATGGSDSDDGLSEGSAFQTIGKAMTVAGAAAAVIYLQGTFVETVTVNGNKIFKGLGAGTVTPGAIIRAPSGAADCIHVTLGSCLFEDVTTQGYPGQWTGIGWKIDPGAAYVHTRRCSHANLDTDTVNNTYGGTALRIEGVEGCSVEDFHVFRSRVGMHFLGAASNGASVNRITGYRAQQVFDLVLKLESAAGSGSGGNHFYDCKSVGSGDLVNEGDVVVDIGSTGGNLFLACDWDENLTGVSVSSPDNTFIHCTSAPSCAWTVSGNHNRFVRHAVLGGTLTVTGDDNIFEDPRLTGNIVDTGFNNRFENLVVPSHVIPNRTTRVSGPAVPKSYPTLTTVGVAGGASAPPATPAKYISMQDPTTGQNLLVPAYLPPASPVLDSFIRADNASVIGTADSTQAWTSNSGQWGISSNRLYHAAANGGAVCSLDSGIADGIVEADLIVGSAGGSIGLAWRLTDSSNFYFIYPSGVKKRVAGSDSAISGVALGTLVAGDHVRVILEGSKVRIGINGVATATFTDTFNQTATKHGFYSDFDTQARWKNFRVTA